MPRRTFPYRLTQSRSGAAAVEFALLALVYLTILLGVIEVARYIADRQDLMTAVHSVGRYAIVHGANSGSPASTQSLQQMVASRLIILRGAPITATASFTPNNNPGSTVTITATYTWNPLVSLLRLPKATITATSAATILN